VFMTPICDVTATFASTRHPARIQYESYLHDFTLSFCFCSFVLIVSLTFQFRFTFAAVSTPQLLTFVLPSFYCIGKKLLVLFTEGLSF
jgi:hypothetical protein